MHLSRIVLEVLGIHECKCDKCDPEYCIKEKEVARISAKSKYRDSIKKEEREKMKEGARAKFRVEMAQGLAEFEIKFRTEFEG